MVAVAEWVDRPGRPAPPPRNGERREQSFFAERSGTAEWVFCNPPGLDDLARNGPLPWPPATDMVAVAGVSAGSAAASAAAGAAAAVCSASGAGVVAVMAPISMSSEMIAPLKPTSVRSLSIVTGDRSAEWVASSAGK